MAAGNHEMSFQNRQSHQQNKGYAQGHDGEVNIADGTQQYNATAEDDGSVQIDEASAELVMSEGPASQQNKGTLQQNSGPYAQGNKKSVKLKTKKKKHKRNNTYFTG